jgi:hypothetical protein
VVVLSSLKVTATEVAVAQLMLEDWEVDVLFEVVAAALEDVVPEAIVNCWYTSLN